jgi:membrane protease YdiL (CAAX protease family)
MPRDELQLPVSLPLMTVLFLLFCGSLVVWVQIVRRLFQGRSLVPYEPRRPVPWTGVDLAAVLCIFVLAIVTVGQVLMNYYHGGQVPKTPGLADLVANLGAELIGVELAILLLMQRSGAIAADFGLRTSRFDYDTGLGVLGYLAVIVPITWMQAALSQIEAYHHPLIDAFHERHDALMIVGSTVAAVLVAPLCEEMFFRVLLQGWFESLESAWRESRSKRVQISATELIVNGVEPPHVVVPSAGVVWWPILLSSGLFSLMHHGQGLAQIPLFFLAIVLGYLYQRTHRLWPSLTVHMLLNAGTMLVLWLQVAAAAKPPGH